MYDHQVSPNKVYRKTRPSSSSRPRSSGTSGGRAVMSLDDILREPEEEPSRRYEDMYRSTSHRHLRGPPPTTHTDPLDTLLQTGSLRSSYQQQGSPRAYSTPHISPGAAIHSAATTPHRRHHHASSPAPPDTSNGQIPLSDPKATLKYVRKVERELADLQTQHGDLCQLLVRTVGEKGYAQHALEETDGRTRLMGVESGERDLLEMWFHSLVSRVFRSDLSLHAKETKSLTTRLGNAERKNTTLGERLEEVRQQQVVHLMDSRSLNASAATLHLPQVASPSIDINAVTAVVEQTIHRECSSLGVLVRQVQQQVGDVEVHVQAKTQPVQAKSSSLDTTSILADMRAMLDEHHEPLLAAQTKASAEIDKQLSEILTRMQQVSSNNNNALKGGASGDPSTSAELVALRTVVEQNTQSLDVKLAGAIKQSTIDIQAAIQLMSKTVMSAIPPPASTTAAQQPDSSISKDMLVKMEGIKEGMDSSSRTQSTNTNTTHIKLDKILALLVERGSLPPSSPPPPVATPQQVQDPSRMLRSMFKWFESASSLFADGINQRTTSLSNSMANVTAHAISRAGSAVEAERRKAALAQLSSARSPPAAKVSKSKKLPSVPSSSDFDEDDDDEDEMVRGKLMMSKKASTKGARPSSSSPPKYRHSPPITVVDDSLRFDETMMSLDLSMTAEDNSINISAKPKVKPTTSAPPAKSKGGGGGNNWDDEDASSHSSSTHHSNQHSSSSASEEEDDESSEDDSPLLKKGYLSISSRQASAMQQQRRSGGGAATVADTKPSMTAKPSDLATSKSKKALPVW